MFSYEGKLFLVRRKCVYSCNYELFLVRRKCFVQGESVSYKNEVSFLMRGNCFL